MCSSPSPPPTRAAARKTTTRTTRSRATLLAVVLVAACPAAPPQQVPPGDEHRVGPDIAERPAPPVAAVGAGASTARDGGPGSRLAGAEDGSGASQVRHPVGGTCYDASE